MKIRRKISKAVLNTLRRRSLGFETLESRRVLATNFLLADHDGDLTKPENWSEGRPPNASDDVIIDLPGEQSLTLRNGQTLEALSFVNLERIVVSGDLSVTQSISGSGSLELAGGSIDTSELASSTELVATRFGGSLVDVEAVSGMVDLTADANAHLWIYGGLELNGQMLIGNASGSTYGRVYFGDNNNPAGALTGSGEVILGANPENYFSNDSNLTDAEGTLTIGAGITLRGGRGYIFNDRDNGTIINQGTISLSNADSALWIGTSQRGRLINEGLIEVGEGTAYFGALMTHSGLGTITRDGGLIQVAGRLDLEGVEWQLNTSTGDWEIRGGTVSNGSISQSDGSLLKATRHGGSLVNIATLNGTLDLSADANAHLWIYGGLELNGQMLIGNASGSTYGRVYFGDNNNAAGALTGSGEVILGANPENYFSNDSNLTDAEGTLTIGAGITLRGGRGYIFNDRDNGTIVNQGTISNSNADSALWIGTSQRGRFINEGLLEVGEGKAYFGALMTHSGLGTITRDGGLIQVAGRLDLEGVEWQLDSTTGDWEIRGGTVSNGSISQSAGSLLKATRHGGSLVNIATLNGTLDLSAESNAHLWIYGGLELNGQMLLGNMTGSTFGRVYFGDNNNAAGSLTGSGGVILGANTENYFSNDSNLTDAAGTLTIGAGITLRGGRGYIFNDRDNGTIVNQGTISNSDADSALWIGTSQRGRFVNEGLVEVGEGTAYFGALMTHSGLGTITRDGGLIQLAGHLDLEGVDWQLNTSTGDWEIRGGTVSNGSITQSDGSLLKATRHGGSLVNIATVNGTLDLSAEANAHLRIYGGLELNGQMLLGNATGSTYGRVYFGDNNTAAGALTGSGAVVLGLHPENYFSNDTNLTEAAGTLTIGAGITLRGGRGYIFNDRDNGTIVNQGTIAPDIQGGLVVITERGVFANEGRILVSNGGGLSISEDLLVNNEKPVRVNSGARFRLDGNISVETASALDFQPAGSFQLLGGTIAEPNLLEASSQDLGDSIAGFEDNFAFGSLDLSPNSHSRLVDLFDNSPGDGAEAFYVNSLVIPADSSLDLNDLMLYTRAVQASGEVLNGSITVIPDSGPLNISVPTPGAIDPAGQQDEWNFFAKEGRFITAQVNPGSGGSSPALSPRLGWARVQIVASDGSVLAESESDFSGALVTLNSIEIPEDGEYRIRVLAPDNHVSATGNYVITAWDTTATTRALTLNQLTAGALPTPFALDQWNFSASAGSQVKFDLRGASSPNIAFTLEGPSNFVGFTDISSDSDLITLPTTGEYTLSARSPSGSVGNYSFIVEQTRLQDIELGTAFTSQYAGDADAQLFRVELPANQVLSISLTDEADDGRAELYARFNSPPSRQRYDYVSAQAGRNQNILVPSAPLGTWYILVYADSAPNASEFTILAEGEAVSVTDTFPPQAGNAEPVQMRFQGAGFLPDTQVELLSSSGETIAPISFSVDSYSQLSATFPSDIDPDQFHVRVWTDVATTTVENAIEITAGGAARLETELIMPTAVRRRGVSTIYVEYANTGDVAMPAPLLAVQSTDPDGSDKPILTLDENRIVQNFWAGGLPEGTSHTALILGSGKIPGVLNPGERFRVPVHVLGLLRPWDLSDDEVEMEIRFWTEEDSEVIDWTTQEDTLRPSTLTVEQWAGVYQNLTGELGTNGAYVQMLNQNAKYLALLGQNVTSVDELWNFEVQQAFGYSVVSTLDEVTDAAMPAPGTPLSFSRSFGNTIQSRYAESPLGRGWYSDWYAKLVSENGGDIVRIVGQAGSSQLFLKDSRPGRGYFASTGDSSTLESLGNGIYQLRSVSGSTTRFLANGKLDFVEDANGNRVSANYDGSGVLVSLVHSNGASLTWVYGGDGFVDRVTDSAGRTTSYQHDADGYLTSVTTSDGKVTAYGYERDSSSISQHALISIERGGTTQYFSFDARGRLDSSYLEGNTQVVDYGYSATGLISVSDSAGTTSLYFDHNGLLAKSTDALGNTSTNEYGKDLRLTRTIGPTGYSRSYTWCTCGSLESLTNEAGHTTYFAYENPLRQMSSFTDANGNTTRYTYDEFGNPMNTVYANGSVERYMGYTDEGLPESYRNRRGQVMLYSYNAAGQVTLQTFHDGSIITFEYDNRGNLTRTVDGDDITVYQYDHAVDGDRLKRVTYPGDFFLDYAYDEFGRRTQMVDQDGFATKYSYDEAGRLFQLHDADDFLLVTYLYDSAGRLSRIEKGNGTFTTYEYDAAGQLLSLKNWRNETELNSSFEYEYDELGRRVSQAMLEGTWKYFYDGAHQLVRATLRTNPGSSLTDQDLEYSYDATGNRLSTTVNGHETEYEPGILNEYAIIDNYKREYDPDGNLISDGTFSYTFDQSGRLNSIVGGGEVSHHEYDAFGNMSVAVDNGIRREFVHDAAASNGVQAIYGQGVNATKYHYGLGLALKQGAEGLAYYEFDGSGSVVGLVGANANSLARSAYLPFGNQLFHTGIRETGFKYQGQFGAFDLGTPFVVMGHRTYSTETGRFLSKDPIGLSGGDANFYRFVNNAPLDYIDPSGLLLGTVVGAIAGAAGDLAIQAGTQLWANDWDFGNIQIDYGSVAQSAAIGAAVGSVGPSGLLFGRGGKTAIKLGYRPGIFNNNSFARLGWSWNNDIGANVFSFHGKFGHFDIPWLRVPHLNPASLELALGTIGGFAASIAVGGIDPNEKSNETGYGPQGFVHSDGRINYRIDFENYESATAPAQSVIISDYLSTDLDWSTFQIEEIAFGDELIVVPSNRQVFTTTVPMTYLGETFDVLLEVGLHASTGEAYAWFQSLDQETELPPNALVGFLPPEDGTGRGLGRVNYSIQPKADLPTGHEIRNVATITFDGQLAIDTDQVDPLDPSKGIDPAKQALVTIDAGLPNSQVAELPAITSSTTFDLVWAGADDDAGSGISGYDVYTAIDDGPFRRFLTSTSETSTSFNGEFGRNYRFYSIAIDNVGHRQPIPTTHQAQTQLVDPAGTNITLQSSNPSNAAYGDTVQFTINVASTQPGDPPPNGNAQLSINGELFGQPIALSNGVAQFNVDELDAGTFEIIAQYSDPTGTFNNNQSQPLTQIVNKALLRVRAEDKRIEVGDPLPEFTADFSGFVHSDTLQNSTTGAPDFTVSPDAASAVGEYPIDVRAGALASANYDFAFVAGLLTVEPVPALSITVDNPNLSENGESTLATIARTGDLANAVTVQVIADPMQQLNVPSSVTIESGVANATILITAIDNSLVDGGRTVALRVEAENLAADEALVSILDDDEWSWQNQANPFDVNDDDFVSPIDALIVINELNQSQSGVLPSLNGRPPHFVDTNGDGFLSPIDALLVINFLNQRSSGEGETTLKQEEDPFAVEWHFWDPRKRLRSI